MMPNLVVEERCAPALTPSGHWKSIAVAVLSLALYRGARKEVFRNLFRVWVNLVPHQIRTKPSTRIELLIANALPLGKV